MATDDKMEQARRALSYMIARLGAQDRFAVVDFATDARAYKERLVNATAEEKAGAAAYVKELVARGGTATDDAMTHALTFRDRRSGRPLSIVFMTDGQPTIGETDPERILSRLKQRLPKGDARVFVWGVGNEVNTHLLDKIAQQHSGDSYYVLPGEDIEVAMSTFYDKISSPVLTDLALSFEGVRVLDVYPRQLPDLFQGSQLIVTGRFTGDSHGAVRLKGKINGKEKELVYEGHFKRHDENPHVPRVWARRKIGFLLDQIRLHGENDELKQEVVRLARRYGLPTPYTSYLVLEEGALTRRNQGRGGERPMPPAAPMDDADAAAEDAFGRMREAAKKSKDGADFAPAAESSGAGAVRGARTAGRLRRGEELERDEAEQKAMQQAMKTIGDRTFYRAGEIWIDSTAGKRDASWKKVDYLSDAYFKLLKDHPELGVYLALGKVVFRVGSAVYDVR